MKRKEVIHEIYLIMSDYYEGVTGKILTEEDDLIIGTKDFAEDILYRLEKLGMLPPAIINPNLECEYDGILNFVDETIHDNAKDYGKEYYVNEWDEE